MDTVIPPQRVKIPFSERAEKLLLMASDQKMHHYSLLQQMCVFLGLAQQLWCNQIWISFRFQRK